MSSNLVVRIYGGAAACIAVAAAIWLAGMQLPAFFAVLVSIFLTGLALGHEWAGRKHSAASPVEGLPSAETELREIVNRVPAMIATASAEGMHDFANKRALDYTGATLEEMRGTGFLSIIHPDDQDRVKVAWMQSVGSSQPMDLMHRLRRSDGEYVWFHVRVEPTFDDAGRVVRWYGVLNNVDDRKKAEDALLESELVLRHLVEAIPALVWRAKPDGKVDYVNARYLEYTGVRVEEIFDSAWFSHVHPDDLAEVAHFWRDTLGSGTPHEASFRLRRSDGIYRWFQMRGEPSRNEAGEVAFWYSILLDIDDSKKAEEARRATEARASRMLESIPTIVWELDLKGDVVYLNRRGINYLASSFSDLQNMKWASRIHPEDFSAAMSKRYSGLANGRGYDNTFRYRIATGQYRWMHAMVEPATLEDGTIDAWYAVFNDIDDHRRAEDAVRASELMLRQLVEAIPALVWRTTPKGDVDFGNSRLLEYTGASLEELGGLKWVGYVHPDDSPEVVRLWSENLLLGKPHDATYRLRRADGTYRWFQVRGEPLRDETGEIANWYGLLLDIDDRKKAEEAKLEREFQASKMLEAIPAPIWATDPQGGVTYLNNRVANFFASSFNELDQLKWVSRIHPDDLDVAIQTRKQAIISGRGYENIFRFRVASGAYRWIHATVEPARDQNASIEAWYGVFFDIDDRRRAEEELQEREQELRLITETIPAIVTSRANNGGLLYANQRFLDYTGKTLDELDALDSEILHPEDRAAYVNTWHQARVNATAFEIACRLRRADGVFRWFQVQGIPLLKDEQQVVRWYTLKIDIDDRKNTEEALHFAQMKLAQNSRLMTVAELSASIAHEINQPLAAVVANGDACQMWLSGAPPNIERAKKAAERVIRDGNAAAEVVAKMRALFKSVAPSRRRLHLNEVAVEVLKLLDKEIAAKGVTVVQQLDSELPTILADQTQIQQILVNLIRNGIDAMDLPEIDKKILTVSSRREQENLLLEISDFGAGIRDPERLFEPFFTTKDDGMGMGLAICKSIVAAHGGRLLATPNVPRGTVMQVSLPLQ